MALTVNHEQIPSTLHTEGMIRFLAAKAASAEEVVMDIAFLSIWELRDKQNHQKLSCRTKDSGRAFAQGNHQLCNGTDYHKFDPSTASSRGSVTIKDQACTFPIFGNERRSNGVGKMGQSVAIE